MKTLIAALLAASAFVPAAVLAHQNRTSHRAFTSEGRAIEVARKIERPVVAESVTTVAPVIVVGARPRVTTRAVAQPTTEPCGSWRTLQAGPQARAAGVPNVRPCDVL